MISRIFRRKSGSEGGGKPRVAYSCFVDSNFKFYKEVFRFIWSLGELQRVSYSDIYVTCASCCDERFLRKLEAFEGINVILRDRMTQVSPPANKWLQLDSIPEGKYSHVIVNDCDKLYVAFSPERWCNANVRAAQFVPRPTFSVFEKIFAEYELGQPESYIAKPDPKDPLQDKRGYINNHNGGLLIFPTTHLSRMRNSWIKWIDALLGNIEILGANHRNLDQVAFSLAMHDNDLKMDFIPKSLDLALGVRHFQGRWMKKGELILHIHGDDDEYGRLLPKPSASSELRSLAADLNERFSAWAEQNGVFELLDQVR